MAVNMKICLFILVFALFLSSCSFNKPSNLQENESDGNPLESTDSDEGAASNDIIKIQTGMKYSEIADILGSEGTDVGYGDVIYRWNLANGEYVDVHFTATETSENKNLNDLVASKITYSQES